MSVLWFSYGFPMVFQATDGDPIDQDLDPCFGNLPSAHRPGGTICGDSFTAGHLGKSKDIIKHI